MKISLNASSTADGNGGKPGALAMLAARWQQLQQQHNQRNPRERLLITAAGAALVLMLADSLWLSPALQAFKAARSAQAAAAQVRAGVLADIGRHESQGLAHARQQQAELAQWRQRLTDSDTALRAHEDSLVGADRMLDLLEQLLARHADVRVRALRSLGRSDLLSGSTATAPAAPASGTRPSAAAPAHPVGAAPAGGLYRHGVELMLEGSYADLLAYLKAVEALPQRLLWGGVSLKVEQHPRAVLTLRVYTLSRDPNWLEI